MDCSMPGFPVHHQLPGLSQTHVHRVNDAIQPSHPLSSPSPPALSLSNIRVFSSESVLRIRWPKYWNFSFSINFSNEYSELISFRMDWLDLLAVQETVKSLLQHHSSKALILWRSASFIVQLSYPYVTIGKTISSVQLLSHVWLFATPWIAARQASLSITYSQSLLKLMSITIALTKNLFFLIFVLHWNVVGFSVMSNSLWPRGL